MTSFRGAYTALITPFRDGRVDKEALTGLVEAQIDAGIDGLVPCGTTGESSTLSYSEHVQVIDEVMRSARGRVPVLAGAGSNCTREAIELARACKELGVAGTLQITPYYNKPPQRGLVQHFRAIADAVALPMIVYNVPSRTGVDLLPATLAEIASHPMVQGIKDATGDMDRLAQVRDLVDADFDLLSGDDFSVLPFLAAGGHGVISVASNAAPALIADLCRAMRAGDLDEARALNRRQLPLTRALFMEANPIPIKMAMAILGFCQTELRSPLCPLESNSPIIAALTAALETIGASK